MSAGRDATRLAGKTVAKPGVSTALTLHFHPLASFCWKALIALYDNEILFTPNKIDLGNPTERRALSRIAEIDLVGREQNLVVVKRDQRFPAKRRQWMEMQRQRRGYSRFGNGLASKTSCVAAGRHFCRIISPPPAGSAGSRCRSIMSGCRS